MGCLCFVIAGLLTEDEVKSAVLAFLQARGYTDIKVAWGHQRGVDIDARGPDGRLLIEAKGDAPTPQMQGNYFLGTLGELLQRMDDSDASYGIALPDNNRSRMLIEKFPDLAVTRLRLRFYLVLSPSPASL
jgi:hypothetical protein